MKEGRFNCVGFAFYKLGLKEADKFIKPPSYKKLLENFLIVTEEQADVIGVIIKPEGFKKPLVHHIAIIDPKDRRFIIHRASHDAPISRMVRKELLEWYGGSYFTIINLKLKT